MLRYHWGGIDKGQACWWGRGDYFLMVLWCGRGGCIGEGLMELLDLGFEAYVGVGCGWWGDDREVFLAEGTE